MLGGDTALCIHLSGGMEIRDLGRRNGGIFGELSFTLALPLVFLHPWGCVSGLDAFSTLGHPHCSVRRFAGEWGLSLPEREWILPNFRWLQETGTAERALHSLFMANRRSGHLQSPSVWTCLDTQSWGYFQSGIRELRASHLAREAEFWRGISQAV